MPDLAQPYGTKNLFKLSYRSLLAVGLFLSLAFAFLAYRQFSAMAQPASNTAIAQSCPYSWNIANSESPGTVANELREVAAVADDDIWAVGLYQNNTIPRTLIEHYDGTAWTTIASPNVGNDYNVLEGVIAIAADDVWAVGSYIDANTGVERSLILHYDGTDWTVVASPNIGSGVNRLFGLYAASPDDLWASGYACPTDCYADHTAQNLILHYDGTAWTTAIVPNIPSHNNYVYKISGSSANDIWVAGEHNTCWGCAASTNVLHYDGTAWTLVNSPNASASTNTPHDVLALAEDDAWIVGQYHDPSVNRWKTLAMHWDGTAWSLVDSPNRDSLYNDLHSIVAIGSNDIWAVGEWYSSSALAAHWDGTEWTLADQPDNGADRNRLNSVAAVSGGKLWAVGLTTAATSQTLVELYSEDCPTPTPTTIPTDTPTDTPTTEPTSESTSTTEPTFTSEPTSTTEPTSEPTSTSTLEPIATPTECSIAFSDVPQGSTFYPYLQCLVCLGIINGYPDGTYRPNNAVTRGQLSKIVANAANFTDAQTTQMFEDVPQGATFYDYINRLAARSYIGGYACGGPSEPCGESNLPYFRPNNTATRGQISKIVSNAAGFNDQPVGLQFSDVPIGSTYYEYTFRLAIRGIMSGYACGGPSEPCGETNLPYFRPNFDATRGQTAKINSNTFFSGCGVR